MKRKYGLPFFTILLCFMTAFSLIPLQRSTAQPDDDPDFIITLALMAVADDRLDGVMDLSALANLRAEVDDYYLQKSYLQMDGETAAALNHQKQVVLTSLDNKIQFQETFTTRARVGLFYVLVNSDTMYQKDPDSNADRRDIFFNVLSSGYKPNPEALAMLNQRLSASTQSSLQQNLDGHVAANVPDGRALVDQSSGAVYDYDAGMGGIPDGTLTVQPRPLNFTNTGSKPVHVSVEYYQPPKGLLVASPGMNVEVPGQGSVVMTGFPQGNYVFCVDWQASFDSDGDGLNDYDRAVYHDWVSTSQPANPQEAKVIHVGASYSATPSGRCDGFKGEAPQSETVMKENFMTESEVYPPTGVAEEPDNPEPNADFWDQDDELQDGEDPEPTEETPPVEEAVPTEEDVPAEPVPVEEGLSLTAAELANQGTHSYSMTCQFGDSTESSSFVATWEFSESGANYLEQGLFYTRVSPNVYQTDWPTIITFTTGGYLTSSHYFETNSEGQEVKYPIECTATFQ